jgi:hypothetical protein
VDLRFLDLRLTTVFVDLRLGAPPWAGLCFRTFPPVVTGIFTILKDI